VEALIVEPGDVFDEGELELGKGGEPMMVETIDGSRFQVSWVNPPRLAYDMYYNTIANPLLWFVQHYLWNLAEAPVLDDSTHRAWTGGYRLVNQLFAQQIVREARRGRKRPLVLSHDYHLYLVPRLVRGELPDAENDVVKIVTARVDGPHYVAHGIHGRSRRFGYLRQPTGCSISRHC